MTSLLHLLVLGTTALVTPIALAQSQSPITEPATPTTRAQAAATALLTTYNPQTGLFNTTGWWNSANALTALTDTARLSGIPDQPPKLAILRTLTTTFTQAPHKFPGFLNDYYDDEGWWALAWIDAFDLTHNQPYLRAAESIFADMTTAWSDTPCGGGIWWSKKRTYKNAIANELFLSVAAHLALRTHGRQRSTYLHWANREWTWFAQTGMINPDYLVNDGLTLAPDSTCHNNGKTTWSYNQGVLLGGLTALSQATHDPDLLSPANQVATAAITHLTDAAGILHDPCEPNCGEDGVSFKGIFARNLADFDRAAPNPAYTHFLNTNAGSLWTTARSPDNRFSTVWSGPANPPGNAGAQASALDLLNAAATP